MISRASDTASGTGSHPVGLPTLASAAESLKNSGVERPAASDMVEALVRVEQATRRDRTQLPVEALLGLWRFCFAANKKSREKEGVIQGGGFYTPGFVRAHIAFSRRDETSGDDVQPDMGHGTERLAIANQLQIGPLFLKLTGPAKYLPHKNLLAFDFTQMQLRVLGLTLYSGNFPGRASKDKTVDQQSIGKLPFFAFVAATERFIAARGRGGGLALWVRDQDTSDGCA